MWCQGVRSERESADGNLFNKRCDAWGVGRAAMDYKRTMTFWRITLRHDANRGEAHPFRSGCYTQHSDGGSFLKACLTKVKEWIGEPFRTCLVLQNALQTWAPGHPDQNLSTKDVMSTGADAHAMVQRATTGHSEEKLWAEDLVPAGVFTRVFHK